MEREAISVLTQRPSLFSLGEGRIAGCSCQEETTTSSTVDDLDTIRTADECPLSIDALVLGATIQLVGKSITIGSPLVAEVHVVPLGLVVAR